MSLEQVTAVIAGKRVLAPPREIQEVRNAFAAYEELPNWSAYSRTDLLAAHVLMMAGLGLGFGIIVSALTTKYRDLRFLVQFGVQLLMYATPVIYPASSIPARFQILIAANPMTSIVETFRYVWQGKLVNGVHIYLTTRAEGATSARVT